MPAAAKLNVRRHAKPSTAYAVAAQAVYAELEALSPTNMKPFDCLDATWVDAEQMTRLALALQSLREQYVPASVR